MAALSISVIIPARDCEEVIGHCLRGLSRQTLAPSEVIVVDDASRDKTAVRAKEVMPSARIISLHRSRGFAGAAAAGYAEAEGEWIALLNADAEPAPEWLEKMAEAASLSPRAGMVASRILLAGPDPVIDSLGLRISRTGLVFLRGHGEKESAPPAPVEEVFGPSAAACMYKKDMLKRTGFFDPSFIAYYEDADLAFRARWRGFICLLAHQARAVHRHSYSYGRKPGVKRRRLQANRLRALVRNWPLSWLIKYSPLLAAADGASVVKALIEGDFPPALLARTDFLRHLKLDLDARSRVMKEREVSAREMAYWLFHEARCFLENNPRPEARGK